MKSGGIYHRLFGYLSVCADGPFTERLINICMHRGMSIWDVKRCGSSRVTFKTDIESFSKMRTPARRTGSHVRIMQRHGLPFVLHRYRRRYITVVGAAFLTVMLWYASTHIMGITVFGNTRIDTAEILSALDECGLSLGSKTSEVVPDRIRNRMMNKLGDLAWIGINANGSRIYIEVVERLEKDKGIDKDGIACNLVASRDGEVELLEVREGQTVVKVGSGVCKGDVLVSGVVDTQTAGFRFVKARGEVFAKTRYSRTRAYPLEYTENISTGKTKKRYSLSVMNFNLPLYISQKPPYEAFDYSEQTNEYRVPIDILPSLFIKKYEYAESRPENKKRTPAEAIELGTSELGDELTNELEEGVEIVDRQISHTLTERGEVEVTVELICRENIAEISVIETMQNDE